MPPLSGVKRLTATVDGLSQMAQALVTPSIVVLSGNAGPSGTWFVVVQGMTTTAPVSVTLR